MMKNSLITLTLSLTSFVLCSCSKSSGGSEQPEEKPVYITVNASIGNTLESNESGEAETFADGDAISVYAWSGSGSNTPPLLSELTVNNSINTLSGGAWKSNTLMSWKDSTTPYYFLGVYPSRKISDFSSDEFKITNDAGKDMLIAVNTTGVKATQNPVSLKFYHVMAKLVVNLTFSKQWDAAPNVSSVKVNAANTATINYLASKPVTAGSSLSDVSLTKVSDNTYSSVMIPQKSCSKLCVTIDGNTYVYDDGNAVSLEPGMITTVNFLVGGDKLSLSSVSLTEWADGETLYGSDAF